MSRPRRLLLRLLAVLVAGFVALNAVALMHARAMTGFADGVETTRSPEQLSVAQKVGVMLTGVELQRRRNATDPSSVDLFYEELELQAADGTRLAAWLVPRSNERGIVVLLHGYIGRRECVLPEARWFHDAGFACLLVDFRGSGESEGMVTTLGWFEALDAAAAIGEAGSLANGLVVVYGQSMGAAAALRAIAELGAEVDALVLESPFHSLHATVEKRFSLMGVPSFPASELLLFWGGTLRGFDAFDVEPARWAEAVEAPALVLHGELDARIREDEAREVADSLGGPATFHLFPGARHAPILVQMPDRWGAAVSAFLATL